MEQTIEELRKKYNLPPDTTRQVVRQYHRRMLEATKKTYVPDKYRPYINNRKTYDEHKQTDQKNAESQE